VNEEKYKIRLEFFEGPLDLLLHLIKKDEVDIYEISIEHITKQYLQYINTFKLLNIDLASEFIVMAANLMYIKSRTLLPKQEQAPEEDVDEEDPRWELIRQLIEYKKFKDAANALDQKAVEQRDYFAAKPENKDHEISQPHQDLEDANVFELIKAFQTLIQRFEETNDLGDIANDKYTVSDKIRHLIETTQPGETRCFEDLFDTATNKSEIIVTFLAILELMKMNQFIIIQNKLLGEIHIKRNFTTSSSLYNTDSLS